MESKPGNIDVISQSNKVDCFSESKVFEELCDACVLAQKEKIPFLTEDYLYLKMNELETNKSIPDYFSSLALLRVLYERKELSFIDYLDFMGYLSSYRFRFVHMNPEDIEKAVLGDGEIKIINSENIRKSNFPFLLAEEYGVSFKNVFNVVGVFLKKIFLDDTIIPAIFEEIFIEAIESFPPKIHKNILCQMLLQICINEARQKKSGIIVSIENKSIKEKIQKIKKASDMYNSDSRLWLPNK